MLLHLGPVFKDFYYLIINKERHFFFFFFPLYTACRSGGTEQVTVKMNINISGGMLGELQINCISVYGELNGESTALLGAVQCQPLAPAVPLKPRGTILTFIYSLHSHI